ncbi:MAG: twin-arginine translocase subunit TatC [Bacteroidetes bacterium]|nr:twin-arginine translocase subunit TatC [Bacteroidota bacterium]
MEDERGPNSDHKHNNLSFLGHLEALRKVLLRSALVIGIFTVAAFIYYYEIFDFIILAPLKSSFPTYEIMCEVSKKLAVYAPGLADADAGCFDKLPLEITTTTMGGDFSAVMMVSFIVGCIVAAPFLFWQIWTFIRPALHKKEAGKARGFVFWTSVLFLSGVLFGYYVISPLSISFLGTFSAHEMVKKLPTLNSYMGVLATTTLATGLAFELPIIIYLLSSFGIVSPAFLRKFRKHAIVVILIIAAIITPPDVFSQIVVSIPLIILYEISILLSAMIQRKKEKEA